MDVFSSVAQGSSRDYLRAAAVQAALELGIFERLEEGARSMDELSWHLGVTSTHRLQALLDVLVLEKILAREGEGEDAQVALQHPIAPAPLLPRAGWGMLAEVIRNDAPLDEPGVSGRESGDALQRFHAHLCSAGADAAAELMGPLAREEGGLLLDLGSGAGAYSKAWLEARTDARALLLDRPEVLELAKGALGPQALARAELRAAELADDAPWPEANVVLLANLLHLFGPEEAQQFVSRAADAALPGGAVVIKDLRLEPDRLGPAPGVLFSLNMALFTREGRVHTEDALLDFLRVAGLVDLELRTLESAPDALVARGRKPRREGA